MNQGITIRMGAARQELQAGPTTIDLASLDKTGRYETRRTLIETLKLSGYFGKREQRRAHFRNKSKNV